MPHLPPFLRLALLGLAALPTLALAQRKGSAGQQLPEQLQYANYHWDDKRTQRLPISAEEAKLPAVVLKDFTATEYFYDPVAKNLRQFTTEHRIVRVNSSDGIEQYNKLAVPVLPGGATVAVRARTLSPRGQVVEVQPESMKELKNQEGQGDYRIFALEGVENGSEIEYFYTRERRMQHFGREIMQGGTPEHNVTVEVIAPRQLEFEGKAYNTDAPVQIDTLTVGKRILRVQVPDLAGLHTEAFAEPKAHRARLEYKLAYLPNRGRIRQFTWVDASKAMYSMVYTLSKDEQKAVDRSLREAAVPATGNVSDKAAVVENYVKTHYNHEEGAGSDLTRMATTHNASELGLVRLTAAMLKNLGIERELVIGSDRTELPFDASFDTWGYLDNFFLYLPATKQYLAPSHAEMHLGMVPAEWTGTPALFVKTVALGGTEAAMGTVREVPALPASASPHDLDLHVQFTPDLDKATIHLRQALGGYQGAAIQAIYPLVPADKQAELQNNLQKSIVPDGTFRNTSVQNVERGVNALSKPFVIESDVETGTLVDKAGPRYLFKVGSLIGQQSELYQEQARQYDVENGFNHQYGRRLVIDLPPGYTVRNLADLNIDVKTGPDPAKPLFFFKSGYTQQGQQLIITSTEGYEQLYWPKKDFEAYRAVINAAANFNKVVLVLEKKGLGG